LAGEDADSATPEDYHAHRIALGVPEGGKDYELGDTYPHEALFDQLNGVSFEKGCYVGQEVVSRMQHRGTARKRVVPVLADATLPDPGTPVVAGSVEIGRLGSSVDGMGLALLRLDRAAEMQEKGDALQAGSVPLRIELPRWAHFALAPAPSGSPA
jgi:folate-binding protein YgfZ